MPPVAVVDTNVWVSAFLNPAGYPARLVAAGKGRQFEVVASKPLLDELLDVLSRPRIMKVRQTTVSDAETFVQMVSAVARLVPVSGGLGICRDPDDDVLLETALAGGATYVVSRDEDVTRDLKLVRQFEEQGVQLLTVSRFLSLLQP
jgi:putative PIN family toxin of toxin-antitoxin system